MRPARCDDCNRELDLEVAHFRHDLDCDRYMRGVCTCAGTWVCADCCPDTACVTPLAAVLRAAHLEQQDGVA